MTLERTGVRAVIEGQAEFLAGIKAMQSGLAQMSKNLTDVEKKSSTAGRTLMDSVSKIGSVAKTGATVVAAALGGIGAAIITAGFKFNAMREQAEVAFTTMLGSGQKAKKFLDDLQSFAARTPFEFPDLTRASQRLLAMGFAAQEILPMMTNIGDAVAGLGGGAVEIDRVTRALGQMQARGKTSSQEMLQLTEVGIPAWKFLAEAIGTNTADAMKKVEKGSIDARTTINAVLNGMNREFGGLMEKQSKTWNGLISTVKDTFSILSGRVMSPFFKMAVEGLQDIATEMQKPGFTAGAERMAAVVAEITKSFVTGINVSVIPALKWIGDNGQRIAIAVALIGAAFIWAHPVLGVGVGLAALVTLIGLFAQGNDKAGEATLRLKMKVLDFAESAINALVEVANLMLRISTLGASGFSIKANIAGIKLGELNPAKKIADQLDASGIKSVIDAERESIGEGFKRVAAETEETLLGTFAVGKKAVKELSTEVDSLEGSGIRAGESVGSLTDIIGAREGAGSLTDAADKAKEKVLTLADAIEDSVITYAEAIELRLSPAQAGALEGAKALHDAYYAQQEEAFNLAKTFEKIRTAFRSSTEAAEKMVVAITREALAKAQAAASAIFGRPSSEVAALQLQLAQAEKMGAGMNLALDPQLKQLQRARDAEIAQLERARDAIKGDSDAAERRREKMDEEIDRVTAQYDAQIDGLEIHRDRLGDVTDEINNQLSLYQAQTAVWQAELLMADKTLLSQQEQADRVLELLPLISEQSARTRELSEKLGMDLIPEMDAAREAQHHVTNAMWALYDATSAAAGGVGAIAGRQYGGPVSAGSPYIVGEHGRELFVPSQSGTVVPGLATLSGGSSVINNRRTEMLMTIENVTLPGVTNAQEFMSELDKFQGERLRLRSRGV